MNSSIDVSIIIVNYRTRGLVKQCLKSIAAAAPGLEYEAFVVDNASGDGLPQMVRESFPWAKLIALPENAGFASANNAAMREAKGRYVFILNPDTMLAPGALETMARWMDAHPDVGMCAPKLLRPDRTRQESVHRFPTPWIPIYRRTPLGLLPDAKKELDRYFMRGELGEEAQDVDWIEGAAMFVRRADIDAIGMFDERYFVYFEDADWARRFWKAGKRVVYLPQAGIIHYHRRESADPSWFMGLTNRVTRIHIASAVKYFMKWKDEAPPR